MGTSTAPSHDMDKLFSTYDLFPSTTEEPHLLRAEIWTQGSRLILESRLSDHTGEVKIYVQYIVNVLIPVLCRVSSIRPVLRHTDRKVRPPEEGTGCL